MALPANPLFFYSAPPIGGSLVLAWLLHKEKQRARRRNAEILAAQRIIDDLVNEHWLLLSETNRVLAESLECEQSLPAIPRLAVPAAAEFCAIVGLQSGTDRSDLFFSSDARDESRWRELMSAVIRSGKPNGIEDSELGASGIIVPLIGREGPVGALALANFSRKRRFGKHEANLARQLAARVAMAIETSRLYQGLREVARAREEIVAMVSHDIRNPLTAIELQAGLLLRAAAAKPVQDAKETRALEQIRATSKRMQKMFEDLLDLTKIEAGKLLIQKQETGLAQLFDEVLEILGSLAREKKIDLQARVEDPALQARIDRERIFQVLLNLCGNAIKFTSAEGKILISAKATSDAVQLAVQDTGAGIAPRHLERIFDRYWQASPETSRAGAGLGLAICKGIVDAHGGRIRVESKLGEGSTFYVDLPL